MCAAGAHLRKEHLVMIINKYITKEVLLNFLVITSILLFVAISNRFIRLLAKIAIGQLPGNLVFKVVGLYIPELLASIMPLGCFIAILFVYGRLHADSEMSVLFTCGINWVHITKVMLKFTSTIAVIILGFTTWLIPNIVEYREQVLAVGEAVGIMQAIVPGQFQTLDDGRLMFYVEDINENDKGQLVNIFIVEQPAINGSNIPSSLITAASGHLEQRNDEQIENQFFLVLNNGHRYTGVPSALNYTVVDFTEYGREIKTEVGQATNNADPEQLMSTSQLLHPQTPGEIAELQWRLSLPLSTIILGLLAVSLAKVNPRQGRFAKFLPATLLYITYFNLMLVTKRWVGTGTLSPYYGILSIHVGFFILGCLLLAQVSGRLTQVFQKYKYISNK